VADESPAEDLLGAILSKPSGGAPAPKPRTSTDLGNLISDLVRPHLVSVDENEQAGMLRAVDGATSGLMRTILHHRKFQDLEAAWRGLYFLVRRTETSTDLKIYILDTSKDELADNLKSASNLEETVLYRLLIKDAYDAIRGRWLW
jgi:type VI secretion system protein ImpC